MRTLLLALFPAVAFAQPFIGPEIASAPVGFRKQFLDIPSPAVAMARDERGTVIAWTETDETFADRLFVVRLDGAAHATGSIREVPLFSAEHVDVAGISIAKSASGPGFILAWAEVGSLSRAVFCRVTTDLTPSSPKVVTAIINANAWPVVRPGAGADWIAANTGVSRVSADDSIEGIAAGVAASDMVVPTAFPMLVGTQTTHAYTYECRCASDPHDWACSASGCLVKVDHVTHSLQLVWIYTSSGSHPLNGDGIGQPAVATDGHEVLFAWMEGLAGSGGVVVAARGGLAGGLEPAQSIGGFGPEPGATRPDIAGDGERYVAIWRTKNAQGDYDIVGASIDRDNVVTPLSIAMSPVDERDPSVIAVGPGRFLIAYEKIAAGERRLAGRFLDFQDRRRAVR